MDWILWGWGSIDSGYYIGLATLLQHNFTHRILYDSSASKNQPITDFRKMNAKKGVVSLFGYYMGFIILP